MFKRIGNFIYLCLVFLCGVLVGEINTHKMITYTHQVVERNNIEKQLIPLTPLTPPPPTPQRIKKVKPVVRSVV